MQKENKSWEKMNWWEKFNHEHHWHTFTQPRTYLKNPNPICANDPYLWYLGPPKCKDLLEGYKLHIIKTCCFCGKREAYNEITFEPPNPKNML